MARGKLVTEELRSAVARLFRDHPHWKAPEVKAVVEYGWAKEKKYHLRVYQKRLAEMRQVQAEGLDKPWNTSYLEVDPVSPAALPWILSTQHNRRDFLAKPLTRREVLWYIRLLGFKDVTLLPPEMAGDLVLQSYFRSNLIASWALTYAERQRISKLAKIAEDFSDLDLAMVTNDYPSISGYIGENLKNQAQNLMDSKARMSGRQLAKFYEGWMVPSVIEYIISEEAKYLSHSLGPPEMAPESLKAYTILLTLSDMMYGEKLGQDPYLERVKFFINMRRFAKNENIAQMIISSVAEFNEWWEKTHEASRKEDLNFRVFKFLGDVERDTLGTPGVSGR